MVYGTATKAAPAEGAGASVRRSQPHEALYLFLLLLTAKQVAAMFCVSERTFAKLRHEPWMPPPIVLGPRVLRWRRADIEAALASAPTAPSVGPEPAQLRTARKAAPR